MYRTRFYLEWLALRAVKSYVRDGDINSSWKRAQRLARLGTKVLRHEWQWALQNLKLVFGPGLSDSQRERLARIAFEQHFGSYLEAFRHEDVAVKVEGFEHLQHSISKKKGAILCGVHLGSWEAGGRVMSEAGIPVAVVYRRAFNPLSDREFQLARATYGVEWIASDDVRSIVKALEAGKCIGLMTDLDTPRGGVVADFLGVPAMCPIGPARFALQFQCPIVPIVNIRESPGVVTMYCERAIDPLPFQSGGGSLQSLTRAINAVFEPWIVNYAEQYNWLHPRWLSRPNGRTLGIRANDDDLFRERSSPFLKLPNRVLRLLQDIE